MLLSESLGVSASQLWKYGVFDSYLGIDSLLHVDPARLRSTRIPELRGGYKKFHEYFAKLLEMIAAAKPGDALERQAINKLIFPEIREAALGYSETSDAVYVLVRKICEHFKHLVEEKGLNELLFDSEGRPKIEKASQLLFFGIADAYCVSNNIDITREPETGRGPADFKLSRGYHERVIVEAKLSSNGKYLDGLTAQLPTYLNAEKAKHGVLLLIKVGDHEKKVNRIKRVHSKLKKSGQPVPDLFIVDALEKLSASKLTGFFDWESDS